MAPHAGDEDSRSQLSKLLRGSETLEVLADEEAAKAPSPKTIAPGTRNPRNEAMLNPNA